MVEEGKFAGHLINSDTELVFMDEWTTKSLTCEDAKRVLQGGSFILAQKHSSAKKVHYNSGFFITTNVLPNFGAERDQAAVYRRLKVFSTKELPKKDASMTGIIKYNSTVKDSSLHRMEISLTNVIIIIILLLLNAKFDFFSLLL